MKLTINVFKKTTLLKVFIYMNIYINSIDMVYGEGGRVETWQVNHLLIIAVNTANIMFN